MTELEKYKKKKNNYNKHNKNIIIEKSNYLNNVLKKVLLSIILFLVFLISTKNNEKFKNIIYENVYQNNISFAKFNSWYKKYLGDLFPLDKVDDVLVFNESLTYSKKEKYLDGVLLTVDNNYIVPSLTGGIVVYIGEKENYGNTIIIEDENNVSYWYSNVNVLNINIYDYVKKGDYLGEVKDNKLIMVFQKKGKIEDYQKYI